MAVWLRRTWGWVRKGADDIVTSLGWGSGGYGDRGYGE